MVAGIAQLQTRRAAVLPLPREAGRAIVAYLRALQISRLATLDDAAPEQREALKKKL